MNDRPNILLISADQMRWDALGCAGDPVIRTPHLDALAARGVRFRNAFSTDPICVPARASIMTGNYPHICTGEKQNGGRIRDGQPLLTEILKTRGYRTYAMGKLHFVPYAPPGEPRLVHGFEHVDLCESGRIVALFDRKGEQRGLEDYIDYLADVGWKGYSRAHGIGNNDVRPCRSPLPPEHTVDHWIADCTLRQLERHRRESPDRPFFMWMSSPKPHAPYDPPDTHDDLYDPREVPPPYGDESLLDRINPYLEKTRIAHGQDKMSPEARRVAKAYYYGCITWMDAQIGRVLDWLDRNDLRKNTLILFTADHGDLMGDFGTWFKCCHQNGSVRVPFIAAGPGVASGGASDARVGLQDILPTLAAAAGADIGQTVQGLDVGPALSTPGQSVRDLAYASTKSALGHTTMVCDGAWKYIYSEANGTEELYDQVEDPGEVNNLSGAPEQRDRRADLRERLIREADRLGDREVIPDGRLPVTPVDRSTFAFNPGALGWRWY